MNQNRDLTKNKEEYEELPGETRGKSIGNESGENLNVGERASHWKMNIYQKNNRSESKTLLLMERDFLRKEILLVVCFSRKSSSAAKRKFLGSGFLCVNDGAVFFSLLEMEMGEEEGRAMGFI